MNTEILKQTFFPFPATLKEIFSRYIFFTDRSPEENEGFRNYINDLAERFSVFVLTFILGLILVTWPSDYLYFENPEIIKTYIWWRVTGVVGILGILILRYSIEAIRENLFKILSVGAFVFTFYTGYLFGSISGYQGPWYRVIFVLPFISLFIPIGIFLRAFLTVSLPFSYFMGFWSHNSAEKLNFLGLQFNLLLSLILVSIIFGHGVYAILRQNYFQSIELEEEREKADELLHNTLPEPIVDRLKRGEDVSDRFEEVTVLFADLVEFTPLADKFPPEDVVNLLDDIFCSFDDLTEEFDVEKIKTIGDEYFIAAGVPEPADDHALRCANYALAMRDVVNRHTRDDGNPFELRIGMNTGSLVAGVIGHKRFAYDVWGDIVNVGSRMESRGEPGEIQVTPATKQTIEDQDTEGKFDFERREPIHVKGKGEMTTYFLSV